MLTAMVMTAVTVMMLMMITPGIRIIIQISLGQSFHCRVRITLDTGIQPDSRIGERHLRSHADTSADQGIGFRIQKEACQGTVPAAVCINDLLRHDLSLFHVIQFKLFRAAEMLEDHAIFICNCYSHDSCSFLLKRYIESLLSLTSVLLWK